MPQRPASAFNVREPLAMPRRPASVFNRVWERPDGSDAPQPTALRNGAAQPAALNSGAAQPAVQPKRYSDDYESIPDAKRNRTGDTAQVPQAAASTSGPSRFDAWKLLDDPPAALAAKLRDKALQHDIGPVDAPQLSSVRLEKQPAPSPFELAHSVADAIEQDLREDGGSSFQCKVKQLRLVIVGRRKYPVDKDLRIPGAAPPGEQQYVEAVVSETLLLRHATAHLVQQVSGDGSAQSSS